MSGILLKNCRFLLNGLIKQLRETSHKNSDRMRLYCSSNKTEKEEELNPHGFAIEYKDTTSEYKTGKKYTIAKLQALFNIRLFTAVDIATRFKKLQLVSGRTMSDNYKLLRKEGVDDNIILEYPDVLAQRYMEEKIVLLKSLPFNIVDLVPLLNLEIPQCKQFIENETTESIHNVGGRLGFLSKLLELSVVQTCDVLIRRPFLRKIDLAKVEIIYQLLTDFGIGVDEIKRDYWIFQYNTEIIKHRLDVAKQLKVDKIKTWMVRAQTEIFNTYIQRRSDNKLILGDSSLAEYLSERLECTVEESKIILLKHPALSNKSMRKMKEIIDFLYADGFTPFHIVRNPKILLHSVETTRKRLKELEAQGVKVVSLHMLTKSQKQYMQYYENLVKSNKNKIKDKI